MTDLSGRRRGGGHDGQFADPELQFVTWRADLAVPSPLSFRLGNKSGNDRLRLVIHLLRTKAVFQSLDSPAQRRAKLNARLVQTQLRLFERYQQVTRRTVVSAIVACLQLCRPDAEGHVVVASGKQKGVSSWSWFMRTLNGAKISVDAALRISVDLVLRIQLVFDVRPSRTMVSGSLGIACGRRMTGMLASRWRDVAAVRNSTLGADCVMRAAVRLVNICNYIDR